MIQKIYLIKKIFALMQSNRIARKFRYILYTLITILVLIFVGLIAFVFITITFIVSMIYSFFTGASTTSSSLLENYFGKAKDYINNSTQYVQVLQEKIQPLLDVLKQYTQLI